MTDTVGILEHCLIATPDLKEGYCVDDNARALIVSLYLKEEKLVDIYLKFLLSAASESGFKNDLNQGLSWDNESNGENFGRVMAALAKTIIKGIREDQKMTALFLFDQHAYLIEKIDSCRTRSWLIYAWCLRQKADKYLSKKTEQYFKVRRGQEKIGKKRYFNIRKQIKEMADEMVKSYQNMSTKKWKWFEEKITYDNGRLPFGLLWAYQLLGDKKYLNVAIQSLDFLTKNIFDIKQDFFSFPGYRGWITKDGTRAIYGQQPIEAGSMVEVYGLAYELTKNLKYKDLAIKAFDWYRGKNILGLSLIDSQTGGIYDGLEKEGINFNQGAESILSYLMACITIDSIRL